MMTADEASKTIYTAWYEDPNECEALLNLINVEGFVLEEAVHEMIARISFVGGFDVHTNKVFEGAPHRGKDLAEIDLWLKINNFVFLIESKRSDRLFLIQKH